MKLGFVSAIFADLSIYEVLQFAKAEQFDCVELMCWPSTGDFSGVCHLDADGFSQTQADEIRELFCQQGVEISALGYYPNPLSPDEREANVARRHLISVIDAATRLNIKQVNTFIGADPAAPLETNFAAFLDVWPEIIRYAESRNVFVGIENCPMLFDESNWPAGTNIARSPDIWRRMFAAIPSAHFGLNFDPSHLVWQMMDTIQPIYDFKDRLFHTHAKDMRVEHDLLQQHGILGSGWHTAKIPGQGDVNWERWVAALKEVGYDGAVCIEVEDHAYCETLELRKQALTISRDTLRPLLT
jgi:sugar phosphate isomerase/epimerase